MEVHIMKDNFLCVHVDWKSAVVNKNLKATAIERYIDDYEKKKSVFKLYDPT